MFEGLKHSRWLAWISIAALAVVSSLTSITNGFAYDDVHIIKGNSVVHTLDKWWNLFRQSYWLGENFGALYRPLTILSYALQWAAGGGSALLYHVVSILLYVLVCVTFFWLVRMLVPEQTLWKWVAWSCAALFAVHPVHVEAVGNIVGQSELFCALFVLLSVGLYIKWRRSNVLTARRVLVLLFLYLTACLFKEHGVLLIGFIAAAELTVVGDSAPLSTRLKKLRPFYLSLLAVGLFFIWLRYMVLGDLQGDVPHIAWQNVSWSSRFWTMCMVAQEWFRLFLWPSRLSIDYAPGFMQVQHGPSMRMLPTFVITMSVVILAAILRKRAPIVTFGALWMVISLTLVSNLIFPSGVILAERTLFLASAGVVMMLVGAAGVLIQATLVKSGRRAAVLGGALLALLIAMGTFHSARRQKIWQNNKTMFTSLFMDAPTDYKAPYIFSGALLKAGYQKESLEMIELAVKLYDKDPALINDLGYRYRAMGRCDKAIPLYRKTIELQPYWTSPRNRLIICLLDQKKFDEAWREAVIGMRDPSNPRAALLATRLVLQKKKEATSQPRK